MLNKILRPDHPDHPEFHHFNSVVQELKASGHHQHLFHEPILDIHAVRVSAVKEIYTRHIGVIKSTTLRLVLSKRERTHQAGDYEQAFFEHIICKASWEDLHKFLTLGHGFVAKSVKNKSIDVLRRDKKHVIRRADTEDGFIENIPNPPPEENNGKPLLDDDELRHCMNILIASSRNGHKYARAFELAIKGHSNGEINEIMGVENAHMLKHRGKERLIKHFEK